MWQLKVYNIYYRTCAPEVDKLCYFASYICIINICCYYSCYTRMYRTCPASAIHSSTTIDALAITQEDYIMKVITYKFSIHNCFCFQLLWKAYHLLNKLST